MIIEGKQLASLDAELIPYAFSAQSERIHLLSNHVELLSGDSLRNCFGGWLAGVPIIRSSAVDKVRKVKELTHLASKLHAEWQKDLGGSIPFRLHCDQLLSPEFEWTSIFNEHQSLAAFSDKSQTSFQHMCSPLDPLIAKKAPPFKVQSVINLLDQMPKLLNMESWVDFCLWYGLLLEEAFAKFPYDSVDEYALERFLKEYLHEVRSLYLKRARQHLLHLLLDLGHPETPSQLSQDARLLKEKEVIKVRYELQKFVLDHYLSLVEMTRIIPPILDAHPELEKIQRIGVYLRELLGVEVNDEKACPASWGRAQMLKQLLCVELKAIPAIHCDTGLLRTHFAFAIRSAVMSLKKQLSSQELVDCVVHWDEQAALQNRMVARQGRHVDHPSTRHVAVLRDLVFHYLNTLCASISQWNAKGDLKRLTGKEYINLAPFNFLPSFHEGIALIEYDYATGAPIKLSDSGLRFLESLI